MIQIQQPFKRQPKIVELTLVLPLLVSTRIQCLKMEAEAYTRPGTQADMRTGT